MVYGSQKGIAALFTCPCPTADKHLTSHMLQTYLHLKTQLQVCSLISSLDESSAAKLGLISTLKDYVFIRVSLYLSVDIGGQIAFGLSNN